MRIPLTPKFEARVTTNVESGPHDNVSEATRQALLKGINQLDQGHGILVGSMAELETIFSEIQGDSKAT